MTGKHIFESNENSQTLEKSVINDLSNVNMFLKDMRYKLIEVLLFIESNNHLSSTKIGLEERAYNRNKAIEILLMLLDMSEDDLEKLYNKRV